MAIGTCEVGYPKRITASGLVAGGAALSNLLNPNTVNDTLEGALLGFFVATTSAGTIVLYDGQSASGTQITGTITPAAGQYYIFPVAYRNGLYATIGGTIDVTFIVAG